MQIHFGLDGFRRQLLNFRFQRVDVGHHPTPYSVFCDVGEFADHLNPRLDIFIPFFGKLSHIVEAEAMHVAQLLIDNDQAAADEDHASKSLMAHFQHRRNHDTCRPFDGEGDCVEKELHPPKGIWIRIADDRQCSARLLVDDVGLKQSKVSLSIPVAMGILSPPYFDELFDERRVGRRIGIDYFCCFSHCVPHSSKSRVLSLPFDKALRSQGGGVPFKTSSSFNKRSEICSGSLTFIGWMLFATTLAAPDPPMAAT